ncbi:hypothetical protein Salat_2096900 [Sesamum alatum]|uniref:Uncharacterized protein n=1 Tax=Sesamum alatum TaxID=300844 RepID=A0AAE1Y0H9_9LAMI|nr:hypothetical protein Salat_2096900 [Sesamum alatum]
MSSNSLSSLTHTTHTSSHANSRTSNPNGGEPGTTSGPVEVGEEVHDVEEPPSKEETEKVNSLFDIPAFSSLTECIVGEEDSQSLQTLSRWKARWVARYRIGGVGTIILSGWIALPGPSLPPTRVLSLLGLGDPPMQDKVQISQGETTPPWQAEVFIGTLHLNTNPSMHRDGIVEGFVNSSRKTLSYIQHEMQNGVVVVKSSEEVVEAGAK